MIIVTFDPQSYNHILVLDAVDELAAVPAAILQFKMVDVQRGVHGVSVPEGDSRAQKAIEFEGVSVGYQHNVLWPWVLWLQFGPLDFEMVGFGLEDAG